MSFLRILCGIGCLWTLTGTGQTSNYLARSYGAKGDGSTLDTAAIQSAIDACAAARGGVVRLERGIFLSGTLILKSGVTLEITETAVLRGSGEIADYHSITPQIDYLYKERFTKSLIYAERQEDIALRGDGIIDGQGTLFPAQKGDDGGRPYIVRFSECRRITVKGLTFINSARWLSHYLGCEDVTISGITIRSRERANRDGIDIDSCNRVTISDCDIFSGDDGIVLKSTAFDMPCRNVTVRDCRISATPSALKLGTESQGGYENIRFHDCFLYDSNCGLAVEEVDGGICRNVAISNIVMRNVEVPIFVRLGNRANPIPGHARPGMGAMRGVEIVNVRATAAGKMGSSITGIPGARIQQVLLRDISIETQGGGSLAARTRIVPECERSYPSPKALGILPAYGIFIRHVEECQLENIHLSFQGSEGNELRHAIVVEDADVSCIALEARVAPGALKFKTAADAGKISPAP